MPTILVRDAGLSPEDDAAFIVEAFYSTLPHLRAIGSGEMWGTTPFSQKAGFIEETTKDVQTSKNYRVTGEGEALRIFIAEVEVGTSGATPLAGLRCRTAADGTRYVAVGAALVRDGRVPGHIRNQFQIDGIGDELDGKEDFLFLDVVVTDYRAGELRKGAGEALIGRSREFGAEKGRRALYLDAWSGNEGRLVGLYERMGFGVVAGFEMERADGTTWPGVLMKMELATA